MSDQGPEHRRRRDILTAAIPHVLAQAQGCLSGIERRDTHTLLALRVIILHWCLDGILRMRGAHRHPPAVARRDARYREAFEILNHKTQDELLDQLTDLMQVPERDWPGVKALVLLLGSLDALNLVTRQRAGHRGIRKQWEAIRQGGPDAERRLTGLLRSTRVEGRELEDWYRFPSFPGLEDDQAVHPEDRVAHETVCLEALTDLVKAREAVLTDLHVDGIPAGPFAALYPTRSAWWAPIAARAIREDILTTVRALHPEADDSLERFPLKAKDRLRGRFDTMRPPPAPPDGVLGDLFGHRFTRPEVEENDPAETDTLPEAFGKSSDIEPVEYRDYYSKLLAFAEAEWGARMVEALEARWAGATWEQAAKVARIDRRELLRRRKLLTAWRQKQGLD